MRITPPPPHNPDPDRTGLVGARVNSHGALGRITAVAHGIAWYRLDGARTWGAVLVSCAPGMIVTERSSFTYRPGDRG